MVLTHNPDYFDKGYPYINERRIHSIPDAATRLAAFRAGESDILVLQSLGDVETLRKTNPTAVVEEVANVLAPFGLALRQDKPPFNDVRVRRAISMAIDRPKQVNTLYEGHAILGWGIPYFYWQEELPSAYFGRYAEGKWEGTANSCLTIPVLLLSSLIVFRLMRVMPGMR
jgi:ABC-type transport system substrate-binding protein